jgi:O-antigen/teichoic acid export membrane protein
MGARGVNGVLSLAYLALATRSLGLEGFGQFILCVTFAQALVGFCSFQTWQAIVRWGQTKNELPDATGFALALDGVTIVIGAIAAALILSFAGDWLPLPPELRLAAFGFTVVTLVSIRSTPTGILRLHDRYARAATADSTTSIVRVIGAAIVALVDPTINGFLLVWAAGEVATAAMYWGFARKTQPIFWKHISLTRIPGREGGAWSFVLGTAFSAMVVIASRQLLVLLVGALGGAAIAGIYRVAMQVGEGLLKLAQALLKATYPELVRSPEAAREIAGRIIRIAVITGIASILLALVAGRWLIGIIAGQDFLSAYTPMILLAAAAAVELVGASLEALLVARGKAITNFLLRLVPTLVGLALLAWLIDIHGVAGASMSVLGASVATVAGLYWANRKLERAS